VLAVPVDLPLAEPGGGATRPDRVLATAVDPTLWERRSCGAGTKGERFYDWAAVAVTVKGQPPAEGYGHLLLIRRSVADPSEVEFFLVHAPDPTPIPELIAVAGMRWKIEENNGQGKDLLGLDQYQVRKWTPWHRHVTACMLAHAFLAATRAQLGKDHPLPPARAC
jgi:SRSO17 transposase